MGPPDKDWLDRCFSDVSQGLMLLHLILAFVYLDARMPLVIVVNVAALISGSIGLRMLRKGRYRVHMLMLYITEIVQLIFSALVADWVMSFQISLVGLTALVFIGEYMGRSLGLDYVPALPLGIVSLAVFVVISLVRFTQPDSVSVMESVGATVEIIWSFLVFALLVGGMYSVVQMTSDSERVLAEKAQTDRLTGLYNRAGYDRLCGETDIATTTLLLVDTDKFKGINDNFGHETGDRVLKKISRELEHNFRRADSVCRIGGDEFAILMVDNETLMEELIADKIGRINRDLTHTDEDKLPYVSVSVGVAHGTPDDDWTTLFKKADAVLYEVKKAGGRGVRFYKD